MLWRGPGVRLFEAKLSGPLALKRDRRLECSYQIPERVARRLANVVNPSTHKPLKELTRFALWDRAAGHMCRDNEVNVGKVRIVQQPSQVGKLDTIDASRA